MNKRGLISSVVARSCLAVLAGGGCAPSWRPTMVSVRSPQAAQKVNLANYSSPGATLIYVRKDLRHPDASGTYYTRTYRDSQLAEGSMVGVEIDPLDRYMPDTKRDEGTTEELPRPANGRGKAFLLALDPPLSPYPRELDATRPVHEEAKVRLFDPRGTLRFDGSLDRTVTFEGWQDIQVAGVNYPDCLRLRADSEIRFEWGPRIDVTEYVWLAEGLGEVSRVDRVSGLAWLLPFGEASRYDLVEVRREREAESRTDALPRWSLIAIHLEQSLPHPRLGGLVAQLESRATASVRENDEREPVSALPAGASGETHRAEPPGGR